MARSDAKIRAIEGFNRQPANSTTHMHMASAGKHA